MYDSGTLAELAAGRLIVRTMVDFYFDEDTLGLWSDAGAIIVGDIAYVGNCSIAGVKGISGRSDLSMIDASLVFNSADDTVTQWFSDYTWHLRRIDVRGVLFNTSMRTVHETPVWRHVGLMEKATIDEVEDNPSTITLKIADLARMSVVGTFAFFTDVSQRKRLATDSALRNIGAISRPEDIQWGPRQGKSGNMQFSASSGYAPTIGLKI